MRKYELWKRPLASRLSFHEQLTAKENDVLKISNSTHLPKKLGKDKEEKYEETIGLIKKEKRRQGDYRLTQWDLECLNLQKCSTHAPCVWVKQ